MHEQCFAWVAAQVQDLASAPVAVLEIGSLDINGSVRPLFPSAAGYPTPIDAGSKNVTPRGPWTYGDAAEVDDKSYESDFPPISSFAT